jgi:stage V sporulation protein SpoVS
MTIHELIDPVTRGFTTAKGCDLGCYGAFGKRNVSDTKELDPGAEDLLL